jgi:hypothetical protein
MCRLEGEEEEEEVVPKNSGGRWGTMSRQCVMRHEVCTTESNMSAYTCRRVRVRTIRCLLKRERRLEEYLGSRTATEKEREREGKH